MQRTTRCLLVILVLGALFSIGCGQGTGTVKGKVTLDGKPLAHGLITFLSETGNNDAFNAAIVDGEYRTLAIPCGPAKVTIVSGQGPPPPEKGGSDLTPPTRPGTRKPPEVPSRYHSPATSGLALTIKPGENPFNADLKR